MRRLKIPPYSSSFVAHSNTGFTIAQWQAATDAVSDNMGIEGVCASDLVRIVVEALGLPALSPEALLQRMMEESGE